MAGRRFSTRIVSEIDAARILGIRAGVRPHRFIGIWVVVVDGRVFVRSWDAKPAGWYHTLLDDPRGALQVGERTVRVRARGVRGERLLDAVDAAYRAKYHSPGSLKYVRGFARPPRRARTTELVPATPGRRALAPRRTSRGTRTVAAAAQ
jgi:hypothetical protein